MPKRRRSLRWRLTLWNAIVWSVIQGTLVLVILLYESNAIDSYFNARLRTRGIDIIGEIKPALPELTDSDLEIIAARQSKYAMFEGFVIALYGPDGQVVAATERPFPDFAAMVAAHDSAIRQGHTFQADELDISAFAQPRSPARGFVMEFPDDSGTTYRLLLVTSDSYARALVARQREVLVASVIAGLLGTFVAGWLISGFATEPLRRVLESMKDMSPATVGTAIDMRGGSEELAVVRRELDAMRSRMQEGFTAQERFISNVSHEIKTPISVLMTEMQTLPSLERAPQEIRDFITSVREELRRLGGMVESFLLLTRVRDGKPLSAIAGAYQVNELIMDAIESNHPVAEQYSVRLIPGLIADEEDLDLAISGVPDLLRTMMDNLVRNAIRFSPHDSRVEISAGHHADKVHLVVRDHGPGIPPEIIDRVFDRFAQSESEERRGRGHGLGLAIAQGIAELHGGSISAENCPDRGCRFTVVLPVLVRAGASGVGGALPHQEVQDHPNEGQQQDQ